MPVKKAKRKAQHQKAIVGYKRWLRKHPKATAKERINAFDRFVDSSELEEILTNAAA